MKELRTVIAVATGGALGAGCRWALLSLFDYGSDDIVVFVINIVGAALLGAAISQRSHLSETQFHFVGAGVTGGFSTFATFSITVAQLIDDGELAAAAISAAVTSVVAVIFAGIGYRIGREIRR